MMSLDLDSVAGDSSVAICCRIYMKFREYGAHEGRFIVVLVAGGYKSLG